MSHRRLAAIGVPIDRGVPGSDPFANPFKFTGFKVGGGREAFRRCKVFMGNLVLQCVME